MENLKLMNMNRLLFLLVLITNFCFAQVQFGPPPKTSQVPQGKEEALLVRTVPTEVYRISFAKVISGNVDSDWGTIVGSIGSGMTVNQSGGNLLITAGTTARSETIIRSNSSWTGGIRLRARTTLSQRIANNNFFIELVDVIGDGLSYTITSATSITVTIPGNTFTSENVGQSMYIGAFSGTGTFLSGRYAIASVSGNDVTFTVSGFAAGTGTCSLFGWNYYQLVYNGATATSASFDTQRKGWNSGATAATINTTASLGHLAIITGNDMVSTFADQTVASATAIQQTIRANRVENVPDDAVLRVQIRCQNGSTAPASGTTWTVGFINVSNYANQDVAIQDVRPMTVSSALPVDILRSATLTTTLTSTRITPNAADGHSTTHHSISAASTNATSVKGSAGAVGLIVVSNNGASGVYFKMYNIATVPTVGTTTPVLTVFVPAGATVWKFSYPI